MSVKESFRHFTVLNRQNQDAWNTNQNQMKKTIHTLSTLGCSRKKPNRGGGVWIWIWGYGISRGIEEIACGISRGDQEKIMWNFQGSWFLVLEFPRDGMHFFTISRGKLNKRKILGGLSNQYVAKFPVCFFFWNSSLYLKF